YDPSKDLTIDPSLSYSTFLGGSGADQGNAIAVDAAGSAYVVGNTNSTDFPTTVGVVTSSAPGGGDVFVTKLTPDGSGFIYSRSLGGTGLDQADGIAVDAAGAAYVVGLTQSTDFPATSGAYQSKLSGTSDAFVLKLSTAGDHLIYATYLGGSGVNTEQANAV